MRLSKKKIEIIQAKHGLSNEDIAKKCGITRQRVSCILNSINVYPKTAGMIAKALGVDVTEILVKES